MQQFYAPGKLLITGEYAVLDGAWALALPTRLGQTLTVTLTQIQNNKPAVYWQSIDELGQVWLETELLYPNFMPGTAPINPEKLTLQRLFQTIEQLNPSLSIFTQQPALQFTTRLQFNRHWGLGSSATLSTLMATWAGVNAYQLNNTLFGGSGYDVAVALHAQPLLYRLPNAQNFTPDVQILPNYNPPLAQYLYFCYTGQKQNSRHAIEYYRQQGKHQHPNLIETISKLSLEIANATTLPQFCQLITQHENLIARCLNLPPLLQTPLLKGLPGAAKSLGAWGGDFVLVATEMPQTELKLRYFNKPHQVVLTYNQMIALLNEPL